MRLHTSIAGVAVLVVASGGWTVAQAVGSDLTTAGPTSVSGTEASGVFELAGRTIREVRYADRGQLDYRFTVHNDAITPVTITGLVPPEVQSRLLRVRDVRATDGSSQITVPPKGDATVVVRFVMTGCESLSARAGSFATGVSLRTKVLGGISDTVAVAFPEELHTGSPREVRCPRATADSRPAG
jgi:hypothetical protein